MSFSFPPLVRGVGGIDGLESHQCINNFNSALKFAHAPSWGKADAGRTGTRGEVAMALLWKKDYRS